MGDPPRHHRDKARARKQDLNHVRLPPRANRRGSTGNTHAGGPPPGEQGALTPEAAAPHLGDASNDTSPLARRIVANDATPEVPAPHPADAVRRAADAQNPAADARARGPDLLRDLP